MLLKSINSSSVSTKGTPIGSLVLLLLNNEHSNLFWGYFPRFCLTFSIWYRSILLQSCTISHAISCSQQSKTRTRPNLIWWKYGAGDSAILGSNFFYLSIITVIFDFVERNVQNFATIKNRTRFVNWPYALLHSAQYRLCYLE